jgi:hypothetical protein
MYRGAHEPTLAPFRLGAVHWRIDRVEVSPVASSSRSQSSSPATNAAACGSSAVEDEV